MPIKTANSDEEKVWPVCPLLPALTEVLTVKGTLRI